MDARSLTYCLAVSGAYVPDDAWTLFYRAAQRLLRENKKEILIKGPNIGGKVTTDLMPIIHNNRSGVRFVVEYESANGKSKVDFITSRSKVKSPDEATVYKPIDLLLVL